MLFNNLTFFFCLNNNNEKNDYMLKCVYLYLFKKYIGTYLTTVKYFCFKIIPYLTPVYSLTYISPTICISYIYLFQI